MRIIGGLLVALMLIGLFIVIPSHEFDEGLSFSPSWDLITSFPTGRSIDYKRQAIQTIILGIGAFLCLRQTNKTKD